MYGLRIFFIGNNLHQNTKKREEKTKQKRIYKIYGYADIPNQEKLHY